MAVAQKYNQFDENKKRTGPWKKYYKLNKRIKYIGQFEDGKEVGTFKFYNIKYSTYPEAIKVFTKDSDLVKVTYLYDNGKTRVTGTFKGKKRVGKWEYLYKKGTVFSEEFYVDGKLNGKVTVYFKQNGKKVMLGAADTFRAAAVDQLKIWASRVDVPIVEQGMNADPASVAFDTLQSAKAKNADVVIIDTAGRLHNKVNLMNELSKIKNVMNKVIPTAPHEILLVLDGSTGQNAYEQAKQFSLATEINALAITKLDGTAKGGVVIGISDQFKIPVKYIGVGEGVEDLQVFNKTEFVDSLFKE